MIRYTCHGNKPQRIDEIIDAYITAERDVSARDRTKVTRSHQTNYTDIEKSILEKLCHEGSVNV